MKLQALQVDIAEEGKRYPIVRHVFIGKTRAECLRYYEAHLKSDEFLSGCAKDEDYRGISCRIASRTWTTVES